MNAQKKLVSKPNFELISGVGTARVGHRSATYWLGKIFGFLVPKNPDLAHDSWQALESRRRQAPREPLMRFPY